MMSPCQKVKKSEEDFNKLLNRDLEDDIWNEI